MTGTFRPSVNTSRGAVKSAWIRSSLPSWSVSNGAWTHTSPLYQSAGLVEKTACDRPLTNVGTAADAVLAATHAARTLATTAPLRTRDRKIRSLPEPSPDRCRGESCHDPSRHGGGRGATAAPTFPLHRRTPPRAGPAPHG